MGGTLLGAGGKGQDAAKFAGCLANFCPRVPESGGSLGIGDRTLICLFRSESNRPRLAALGPSSNPRPGLSLAYRAIYVIRNEQMEFVSVEKVSKHDY